MRELILVIGNKNYSSWSLRAWLPLKQLGIPFRELRIPLRQNGSHITEYSPSGKVPVLIDGQIKIWESLAICEYIAEKFPDKKLWPKDPAARAHARSVSSEMHAGFMNLRENLPMNCKMQISNLKLTSETKEDIDRVISIWKECRKTYGKTGQFLFSDFTIADAMFAPVCIRLTHYGVPIHGEADDYRKFILSLPAMKQWIEEGRQETERIPDYEPKAALA